MKQEWLELFHALQKTTVPSQGLKLDHHDNIKAVLAREMQGHVRHGAEPLLGQVGQDTSRSQEDDEHRDDQRRAAGHATADLDEIHEDTDLVAWAEKEYLKMMMEEEENKVLEQGQF